MPRYFDASQAALALGNQFRRTDFPNVDEASFRTPAVMYTWSQRSSFPSKKYDSRWTSDSKSSGSMLLEIVLLSWNRSGEMKPRPRTWSCSYFRLFRFCPTVSEVFVQSFQSFCAWAMRLWSIWRTV